VMTSGLVQAASMVMPSLAARYSGSDLPAWRMNHTGVWGTGSRRHARRNGESCVGGVTLVILSQDTPPEVPHPDGAACHPG